GAAAVQRAASCRRHTLWAGRRKHEDRGGGVSSTRGSRWGSRAAERLLESDPVKRHRSEWRANRVGRADAGFAPAESRGKLEIGHVPFRVHGGIAATAALWLLSANLVGGQ